jgi:hypothetical protein
MVPGEREGRKVTHLTKSVRRSTDVRVGGSRPISVELRTPGVLVLRERGRRTGYEVSIAACYVLAAKLYAQATAERQLRERNEKRAAQGKAPVKCLRTRRR